MPFMQNGITLSLDLSGKMNYAENYTLFFKYEEKESELGNVPADRTKHATLNVEMPGDNRKSKVHVGSSNTGGNFVGEIEIGDKDMGRFGYYFSIGKGAKNVNMSSVDVRMASVGSVTSSRKSYAPIHYVGVFSGRGYVIVGKGFATMDWLEHGCEMSSDNEDDFDDDIGDLEEDDDGLFDICSDKDDDIEDDENYDLIKQKPYKHPFKGVYANPFYDKEGEDVAFQVGQVFKDVTTIREALKDYAMKGGYEIHRKKNDNRRITTTCATEGCDWGFLTSILADDMTFMLKTLNNVHSCMRPLDNKNLNSTTRWIVEKLMSFLRANPDMSYELMQHHLLEKWGVDALIW
ncbi:hypothetical protein GH714_010191 [Hevea brasiliensis]|uniref:Transposase MuDR plant domain-containing protein n=1 Tax=Hevea brasiliensis TaxID=3981 RepID=A0A6A6KD68_HEVBR|nr:hypothetical protein GH714_010191 [Hevea brasiliensis]